MIPNSVKPLLILVVLRPPIYHSLLSSTRMHPGQGSHWARKDGIVPSIHWPSGSVRDKKWHINKSWIRSYRSPRIRFSMSLLISTMILRKASFRTLIRDAFHEKRMATLKDWDEQIKAQNWVFTLDGMSMRLQTTEEKKALMVYIVGLQRLSSITIIKRNPVQSLI